MAEYETSVMSQVALALLGTDAGFEPASTFRRCTVCAAVVPASHTPQHVAFHEALAVATGAAS